MRSKTNIWQLLVCIGLLLTSCSGTPEATSVAPVPTEEPQAEVTEAPEVPTAAAELSAEVLHWWRSGSESKAIAVFAEEFEKRGGTWVDNAQSEADVKSMGVNRILAGDPPTMMQWVLGVDLRELAGKDMLNDIDAVAKRDNWESFLPPSVYQDIQVDGKVYAVPVNIHGGSWMWYNKKIFDEVGVEPPTSWDEFFAAADAIKAAGYTPLALGGENWVKRYVFTSALIDVGGADLFRKIFIDKDVEAARSPEMLAVWTIMAKVRDNGVLDDGVEGREWNEAANMISADQAALFAMGDWAKGEFAAADKVAGVDYGCTIFPGPDGRKPYIMGIDVFAFAKTDDPAQKAAQELLVETMMDPEVQVRFNTFKGSVPVRLDAPVENLDICGQEGLQILQDPANHLPHPYNALAGEFSGAMEDLYGIFLADPSMTPEQGMEEFALIVEQAAAAASE